MSSFITETTDEVPSVLLITTQNSFQQEVTALLEKKGLLVVQEKPESFVAQANSTETFYKIIWITEGWSGGETQHKVLEYLRRRSEPKIVIARTVTPIATQDERFQEWSWAAANQALFVDELVQKLPNSALFLLENVIDPLETASLPLHWFLPRLKQKNVLVPSIELSLQAPRAAFAEVSKVFFDAHQGQKIVVRGQVAPITSTLQALYKQVFTTEISFTKIPVQQQTLPNVFREVVSQPEELGELLATSVSLRPPVSIVVKPQTPPSLPPQAPLPEKNTARFTPIPIPVIDNRLKKYERKKQQASQQKRATKYLREFAAPVPLHKKNSTRSRKITPVDGNELLIDEKIQHLFGEQRAAQKISRVQKNVKKTVRIERKNQRRTALVVVLTLLMGVGVLAGVAAGVFQLTRRLVLGDILQFSQQPGENLAKTTAFLTTQLGLYQLILGTGALPESSVLSVIGQELASTTANFSQLQNLSQQAVLSFFGKNSNDMSQTFTAIATQTASLYKTLSILQAQLTPNNFPSLSDDQVRSLNALSTQLQEKRRTLANVQQLQQILPSLLAEQGRKSYIIMLQDTNELRPTGGFFHAFAWVTIEKGMLIDAQVYNVAAVDAQFQGVFQPPVEVQRYLATNRWLLRDANWDPSFPVTAQQVSAFIEKSLGKKADGVIAINLFTVQSLLHDLGPVNINEYGEVVTDKNLLERVASHSEIQLVQTDKPDYLTDVFGKVLTAVQALPAEKSDALLSDVATALRQNQAFIMTTDPTQNTVLSGLGWTGELSTPQCPAQLSDVTCLVDATMQVETNVGVNETNYTIDRSIQENIAIARDGITHQRLMAFHNSGTSEAWPMGTYRNYLRIYVPQGAQLKALAIDDAPVPTTSITVGHEGNKEYFGVLVEVPIQKTVKVELDYLEPTAQSGSFSYAFFDQKQAGTGADPLQITLQPDAALHPVLIAPAATITQSEIQFSGARDKHTFVGVKFQ